MHRIFALFVSAAFLLAILSCPAYAGHGHNHGLSVSIDDDEPVTSCDRLHIRPDDREVARSEDHLTIPQTSSTLRVESAQNGGIYVYGWDRQEFGVLNCKAALADERAAA